MLRSVHAGARLVLAPHPSDEGRYDALWIAAGRVVDWGALPEDPSEVVTRTGDALRAAGPPAPGGWLPADEVDEARLVGAWLAANEASVLELEPRPAAGEVEAFVARAR